MAEQKKYEMRITRDLRPVYYDEFRCLAQQCCISCCKGWHIPFDKKDYLSIKRQQGSLELNETIAHSMRRIRKKESLSENFYAEFVLEGDVCPFLAQDCLCNLQREKGHDALPDVCKLFPRAEAYLPSGYLERSLSLGCESVLNLLWDLPEGIDFISDLLRKERYAKLAFPDSKRIGIHFQDIRSWCIDMLQNRQYALPERILRMGMALKRLAEGETNITRWLSYAQVLAEDKKSLFMDTKEQEHALPMFLSNNTRLLLTLSSPNEDFEKLKKEIMNDFEMRINAGTPQEKHQKSSWATAKMRYEENFSDKAYFMENIMVSVFFYLHMPNLKSAETAWENFVSFCNLYSFYRFMMVMSCREGSEGSQYELFRSVVHTSRMLLHNRTHQDTLRDEFFQHDSATLAHMAILLSN